MLPREEQGDEQARHLVVRDAGPVLVLDVHEYLVWGLCVCERERSMNTWSGVCLGWAGVCERERDVDSMSMKTWSGFCLGWACVCETLTPGLGLGGGGELRCLPQHTPEG